MISQKSVFKDPDSDKSRPDLQHCSAAEDVISIPEGTFLLFPSISDLPSKTKAMQPQILLLKEGTENAQGKQQVISNINACCAIVDAIRTTLGPRGMDKLIVDGRGKATISNDGATIMKLLDVVHPAAKSLVDIAKSQVQTLD